ncbi:MAG: tRNA pseudouridine(13) synthase TruD, partial [Thermoplasmata archaeon]|nr:tRNA pseudouridine(13) synthase TruD [Thermoplasmata archaeon]
RFGEVRPVTHDVGRWIARGDLAGAVECYLTAVAPGLDGLGVAARREYASHHDAAKALRDFPPQFRFERQLLDHLAKGHTAERALRALSRDLRTLFIHAYQALLFNRYVSRRRARGYSLTRPIPGDVLLRVARDGTVPGNQPIPVSDDNLTECTDFAERGRALVAGPLVGYETPRVDGPASDLLEGILAEEGVERESFRVPASPDLASAGSHRPLFVPLPPIAVRLEPGADGAPSSASLHFALPKGSYATVLLREFLKTGAQPATAVDSNRVY